MNAASISNYFPGEAKMPGQRFDSHHQRASEAMSVWPDELSVSNTEGAGDMWRGVILA